MINPEKEVEGETSEKENPENYEFSKTSRVRPMTSKFTSGFGDSGATPLLTKTIEPEVAAVIKGNALKYHNS